MTKDARLAAIVLIKVQVAHPQQRLRLSILWMFVALQAGMNVDGVVIFVEIGQLVEKIQMLRRHTALNRAARVIKILLVGYSQSLAGILLKSALAAGDRSNPKVRTAFNKIQQQLLVIAAQAKHAIRILALQFQYQSNTAGSVRAAID